MDHLPKTSFEKAVRHYEQALQGAKMDDVHYWPFTDMDFLKFLYDCIRAGLLPFRCTAFWPCVQNSQQFMIALQYDQSVMTAPEQSAGELAMVMQKTTPDYFSSKDIAMSQENENLRAVVNSQKAEIKSLTSKLEEYKEIIREQEYVIDVLKTEQE